MSASKHNVFSAKTIYCKTSQPVAAIVAIIRHQSAGYKYFRTSTRTYSPWPPAMIHLYDLIPSLVTHMHGFPRATPTRAQCARIYDTVPQRSRRHRSHRINLGNYQELSSAASHARTHTHNVGDNTISGVFSACESVRAATVRRGWRGHRTGAMVLRGQIYCVCRIREPFMRACLFV